MDVRTLVGLTWDHERGRGPLEALDTLDRGGDNPATVEVASSPITWDVHSLAGFESADLSELATQYDAIIIDHPHIADAVSAGALVSIDDLLPELLRQQVEGGRFVGPSLESYTYAGQTWALPADAATQVMAARPSTAQVDTWADVLMLAKAEQVLLCLAGPHALSTLVSILVSQGHSPAAGGEFLHDREAMVEAMEFLRELRSHTITGVDHLNPIQSLTLMVQNPAIALIPLVYGYVNFAQDGIDFRNAPSWEPGGRRGAVLGGTGIAVTTRGSSSPQLLQHVQRLVSEPVQVSLVPQHGGQPAATAAWESPVIDQQARGFYSQTRQTLEHSWVRPRRRGWLAFYDEASATLRDVLTQSLDTSAGAERIADTYRDHVAPETH